MKKTKQENCLDTRKIVPADFRYFIQKHFFFNFPAINVKELHSKKLFAKSLVYNLSTSARSGWVDK